MRSLILIIGMLLSIGCSHLPNKSASLYQELGGTQGIDILVHELLVNIANDNRIVDRFRDVNIERFKAGLVTYICSISGGPCTYSGDSMKVIHAGHQYTNTEFNALVDNLIQAMEAQQISVGTQNRLLALLAPSYQDVVYQ
jgi:hemoglobin